MHRAYSLQDKDSIRSSINKRMNVVHRCIRTPNIVLRALSIYMQDKDSIRSSINKRMNVVHRCIRTPNIVLSVRKGCLQELDLIRFPCLALRVSNTLRLIATKNADMQYVAHARGITKKQHVRKTR